MPYFSASTVTISKEDGKLVVIRKPVYQSPSAESRGCFMAILYFLIILGVICSLLAGTIGTGEATTLFLAVSIATFITAALVFLYAKLTNPKVVRLPDYENEILTFEADKFVVQCRDMITSFSYRRDARPVLRRLSYHTEEYVEIIIPCSPLSDDVPYEFHWGYYEIPRIQIDDAKQIFAAIKEYLDTI